MWLQNRKPKNKEEHVNNLKKKKNSTKKKIPTTKVESFEEKKVRDTSTFLSHSVFKFHIFNRQPPQPGMVLFFVVFIFSTIRCLQYPRTPICISWTTQLSNLGRPMSSAVGRIYCKALWNNMWKPPGVLSTDFRNLPCLANAKKHWQKLSTRKTIGATTKVWSHCLFNITGVS